MEEVVNQAVNGEVLFLRNCKGFWAVKYMKAINECVGMYGRCTCTALGLPIINHV